MYNSVQRSLTEQPEIDKQLDRMFFLAAEEKLLPKIIYDYSTNNKEPKFINEYRRSVKKIYTKQTNLPLRYNPEQAKTHRQKFREKVLKLISHELPIEYLKSVQIEGGKHIMTYKGHPLEEVQYPSRQGFEIFNNFNETKFKKGANHIFDDKLEYRHKNIIQHAERTSKKRSKNCMTEPHLKEKYFGSVSTTLEETPVQNEKKNIPLSLPKLIDRTQIQKNKQVPPISTVRTKKPRKMNPCNQRQLIIEKMKAIGGYNSQTQPQKLLVTKQSIIKFFKQFYPRPHRIIDFLEFSDVENIEGYAKVPQRLKLMPHEHICFMSFMFYDSNNDGYICDNDLLRISELLNKCPLLHGDYEVMRKKGLQVEYSENLPYKQLYKLSEVSESTYFNWMKKQEEKQQEKTQDSLQKQVKGYFGYLNRKKIMINYQGFKKLMKGEKTFLWYDLLWRISGITYPDLKYKK